MATGPLAPTAAQPLVLTPTFAYDEGVGCGNVFFYARNIRRTEFLRIEVDFGRVPTRDTRSTFDLAKLPSHVSVSLEVYETWQINEPTCTDLVLTENGKPPEKPQVWRPVGGVLRVRRGFRDVHPMEPGLFNATLSLSGAEFRGPDGQIVGMVRPYTWTGVVGWQAG